MDLATVTSRENVDVPPLSGGSTRERWPIHRSRLTDGGPPTAVPDGPRSARGTRFHDLPMSRDRLWRLATTTTTEAP